MVSRTVRTPFGDWWWTVDRAVLAAMFGLMLGGIILSLAASPPVAARLNLDAFHFVNRHILFLAPTVVVLLTTSFLSPRQIRRVALVVFLISLLLVAATPFFGAEIKGARRWLVIFGISVQPSEFLKPAFVILIAWLFAESTKRPEMPANTAALALLLMVVTLLVLQPDFGQTMLIALVWGALFLVALLVSPALASSELISPCRTSRSVSSGSWTAARATPSTSISRWKASLAAAGSAKVRAKARSSAFCRRATPISCSPSVQRSSASRSV
jgi:cell division protein FtsW (lipid II flippase)